MSEKFISLPIKNYFRIVFLGIIILQVLICCLWCIDNWGIVPSYGDCTDYLLRAKPLLAHKIRPFSLALIIRICQELVGETYRVHMLYSVQMLLAFTAFWLISGILLPQCSKKIRALITLIVGTNPLVVHFNYTITPDSLAMSFTLLTLYFLWKLCTKKEGTPIYIYKLLEFITFVTTFILATNTRTERFFSLTFGIFFTVFILWMIFKTPFQRKRCMLIIGLVIIGIFSSLGARKILPSTSQTFCVNYNFHRYHLITGSMIWGRLTQLYPHFPQYIKDVLPMQEAINHDEKGCYFYQIKAYIDTLGKQAYKDIIYTAVKQKWTTMLYEYPLGAAHYALSVFYPYINFKGTIPKKRPLTPLSCFYGIQMYTYERMAETSPRLTLYYWRISICVLIGSFIAFLMGLYEKKLVIPHKEIFIFLTGSTLMTAIIFSLVCPVVIHIRYTMTWHATFLLMMMAIIIPYLYNNTKPNQQST